MESINAPPDGSALNRPAIAKGSPRVFSESSPTLSLDHDQNNAAATMPPPGKELAVARESTSLQTG